MNFVVRYDTILMSIMLTHQVSLYCFADRNDFLYKETLDQKLRCVGITRVCCNPEMIFIHKKSSSRTTVPAKSGRVMSAYSKNKFADISKKFDALVDAIKSCYTGSLWHGLLCAFKRKFLEFRSSELQRQMSQILLKH